MLAGGEEWKWGGEGRWVSTGTGADLGETEVCPGPLGNPEAEEGEGVGPKGAGGPRATRGPAGETTGLGRARSDPRVAGGTSGSSPEPVGHPLS